VTEPGRTTVEVPDPELLEDYRALRQGLGARRLDRDVLSVSGPDAFDYLQGQCSQDLAGLVVGRSVDSLLLEPDGRLCALVRVARIAEGGFVVDVEGGYGDVVAQRLARFRLRSKVTIEPTSTVCVALRGPDALSLVGPGDAQGVLDQDGDLLVLPFSWQGTEGVDLLGPGAEGAVPSNARWCGEESWEAMRVEAGIPVMGRELDGRTIAAEAGLLERTVSFTKGCYTGQELIARLDARGNRVARRLCGVVLAQGGGEGSHHKVDLLGAALVVEARTEPVGTVTSSAWCPGLGAAAGLAYLHRSVEVPGAVTVVPPDGSPIAGVPLTAEGRTLPLIGS
jgi:tRNA-modifying protein YgfZ